MTTVIKTFRYQLPKKAVKGDCPDCGQRHKKTLSRYIDSRTGDPLPDVYGRCDRESNCGYQLSPYHKTSSGMSYAEEVNQQRQLLPIPKAWFRIAGKQKRNGIHAEGFIESLIQMEGATLEQAQRVANYVFDKPSRLPLSPPPPVYCIPDEVFEKSLGHYEQNQFARLLTERFGQQKAIELLERFHIGTSSRWQGACVFWYIDETGRKRGGQIKLFDEDWHTVKYTNRDGKKCSKTSWVHSALIYRLEKAGRSLPEWLMEYEEKAERSPCLFGLPQLLTAPIDYPIAVVESPKTAVICSVLCPEFIWLATGALSYLNAKRMAPLRGRKITLYPDLNAYYDRVTAQGKPIKGWLTRANELRQIGFDIDVSDCLESNASDEDKQAGLDLADFLLMPETDRPRWILNGETIYGEVLTVAPCDDYPAEWDTPAPQPTPKPLTISVDFKSPPLSSVSEGFPRPPLAFDALFAIRRIRWCVIPDGIAEEDHNPDLPTLIPSPNRERFANLLGLDSNQLPLYQITPR